MIESVCHPGNAASNLQGTDGGLGAHLSIIVFDEVRAVGFVGL
jgi:hypothetical protein